MSYEKIANATGWDQLTDNTGLIPIQRKRNKNDCRKASKLEHWTNQDGEFEDRINLWTRLEKVDKIYTIRVEGKIFGLSIRGRNSDQQLIHLSFTGANIQKLIRAKMASTWRVFPKRLIGLWIKGGEVSYEGGENFSFNDNTILTDKKPVCPRARE
jgi:hypothetical protein